MLNIEIIQLIDIVNYYFIYWLIKNFLFDNLRMKLRLKQYM